MNIRSSVFWMVDRLVRKGSAITRLLSLPSNYHTKTTDLFLYEQARMVNTALGYCMNNKIIGDYAEFGVYAGQTTLEVYKAAYRFNLPLNFHLFDSFQGLPETNGGSFHTGQFACSRLELEANLKRGGVDLSRFTITEGFFSESLLKADCPQIAVAWVDCDLYDSTVPVLEFLKDRLVNNAVLIFDDWFCLDGKGGERRACREWIEHYPQIDLVPYRTFHWAGQSFIFTRSDSAIL